MNRIPVNKSLRWKKWAVRFTPSIKPKLGIRRLKIWVLNDVLLHAAYVASPNI